MKLKEINGKLNGIVSLDQIEFEKIRTEVVRSNNKFSGKINFPVGEVGDKVYILYPKGGHRHEKGR